MANLQDIRRKILSTKKTQQTTRAMRMVSAAKLRRAQEKITQARPYANRIQGVIHKIAKSQGIDHPLLGQPTAGGKTLAVVLTSDRGLCGGFNNSVIRQASQVYDKKRAASEEIDFLFIGRRGADFFRKQKGVEAKEVIYNLTTEIGYKLAAEISDKLLQFYLQGEYAEIRIIYNEFKSAISQVVKDERVLPLASSEAEEGEVVDFIFEPDVTQILDQLLTKHFAVQIYKCLQESVASEHGARMSAMENATNNAGEIIDQMTLSYNKIRQAAITTELIEITSGAESLKG